MKERKMIMKKLVSFGLSLALAASALSMTAFAEEDKTITVAASATPHAEILEQAKPLLKLVSFNRFLIRWKCSSSKREVNSVSYTHLTLPTN